MNTYATYHDTTNLEEDELARRSAKATAEKAMVLAYMRDMQGPLCRAEVFNALREKGLVELEGNVGRCLTDLTKEGLLVKRRDIRRMGNHGATQYCYQAIAEDEAYFQGEYYRVMQHKPAPNVQATYLIIEIGKGRVGSHWQLSIANRQAEQLEEKRDQELERGQMELELWKS